jgi:hypothetical protein
MKRIGKMTFVKTQHRSQFRLRLSFAASPSYEGGESGLRQERASAIHIRQHLIKETSVMKKKHTGTQIVAKLRQADILIGQGKTVPEVCKEIEVSEHTYYRWRQKYGGMNPEMVKELRALQKENARLRKVVADQAVENAILKEVASKN